MILSPTLSCELLENLSYLSWAAAVAWQGWTPKGAPHSLTLTALLWTHKAASLPIGENQYYLCCIFRYSDREKSVIRWPTGLIRKFQSPTIASLPPLHGAKLLLMQNAELTAYKLFPLLTLGFRPLESDLLSACWCEINRLPSKISECHLVLRPGDPDQVP